MSSMNAAGIYWLSSHLLNTVLLTYPDSGHGSLFQFHESFTRQARRVPGLGGEIRAVLRSYRRARLRGVRHA